jgi:nucleoside-diphosphate-sugar epimerase
MAAFYKNIFTDQPDDVLQATYGYIHVHDIAAAHAAALKNEAAGGERIIISEGTLQGSEHRSKLTGPSIIHRLHHLARNA